MQILKNYVLGTWHEPNKPGYVIRHAVTNEPIAVCSTEGLDFKAILSYGRERGGPLLQAMTFPERAEMLLEMTNVLKAHLPEFYDIAATYGATRQDAWMDIEAGIYNLGFYGRLGKTLPARPFLVDGEIEKLSKRGTFAGAHICVPLEGVAVQINAYNFPSWVMLEKFAASLLAGMPNLVKPAKDSAWLSYRMVAVLIASGVMPEGSLQLVCGSPGDLLDHLTCQDVVCFTGSAETGRMIKIHPAVVDNAVRVNAEADSLNCIILGPDTRPGMPLFDRFIKEIFTEMTVKAGQKCTAIRRILVPHQQEPAVIEALGAALTGLRVGDPGLAGVEMGPLVSRSALETAREKITLLEQEADLVLGNPYRQHFEGENTEAGAFLEPILLRCRDSVRARLVHEIEVFGPVATLIGYQDADQAIDLARRGNGSLVGSVFSEDEAFIRKMAFGLASFHGRLLLMNEAAAAESSGHGAAMPQLVHGGPGRAGGGEELAGLRSLSHFLQRVALQGAPDRLERLWAPET